MSQSSFTVKIADVPIKIYSCRKFIRNLCRDYVIEEETPCFSVEVSVEELQEEHKRSPQFSADYLEGLCIQRKIAEHFPIYNRILCHGAAITYQEQGYIFTAPSGTGKSTHIRLWKQYLQKEVDIINGDKPFLSINDKGIFVWGSPWAGKENWQKNRNAPLKGICLLKQSRENKIWKLHPAESTTALFSQIYMPQNQETAGKTMELVDRLLSCVQIYQLECDISSQAVKTGFEGMTGKIFKG